MSHLPPNHKSGAVLAATVLLGAVSATALPSILTASDRHEPAKPTAKRNTLAGKKTARTVTSHPNYITYNTAEELDRAAALVVVASPVAPFEDRQHLAQYFPDGHLKS